MVRGDRRRGRGALGVTLVGCLTAGALAGCATSVADPSARIAQLFQQATGRTATSVSCPSDIPIAKGYQFNCTVVSDGQSQTVNLMEMTANSNGSTIQIVGGT